ncbi:GntR family transcriptional regulator [Aurantimonas sp. 22II-16-19i]|uniref:GntR family transcriptional regulator n=1 Tax=Aurantimonas sp. 22II-16-19i TaxID=1317114 RepID=UPI0009F7B924|nr:GntR family transcriptional regulator [Aurantimonas sp. 22II-16-19i]ORE92035.1 GntR family transcriptional regulator [Aurantimonas sp. 22II-16-19i]
MAKSRAVWPVADEMTPDLVLEKFAPERTFKVRVYAALKHAIANMDIYANPEETWLDERQLAERLGVSRTPIREAIAMLEQQDFVKSVPRRGIVVLKKTKREVIEMIEAWAALESMAVRLIALKASDAEIATLRPLFDEFNEAHRPSDHLSEYSKANIRFHQSIIALSGSKVLQEMTEDILLHVRGIRQMTIGLDDRAMRSIEDHKAIIDALERRDVDLAEKLSRDHTLGLAAYVDEHGEEIFP